MAKVKVEALNQYHAKHGWSLKDRVIAHLPRYAPMAAAMVWLANAARPMAT